MKLASSIRVFMFAGGALLAGNAVAQQPIELKLGTFTGPQHPVTAVLRETAATAEKVTNGRVKVRVFDSGTLGTGLGTLDAVQRGVMDLGNYVWTYASMKRLPFLAIGGLPYVYRDGKGYADAWEKDPYLLKTANEHVVEKGYDNVFFAAPYYSGFARIGFKTAEPKVPNDIKNLKIRGTGTYNEIVESYGAVVVTIATPEVYGALERGIIDGAVGLDTNWTNWRWMEQAKYLLDFAIAPVGGSIAVNKAAWSKISPEDQKKLEAYFQDVQAGLNKYYQTLDETENRQLATRMKIYRPTAEERKLWGAPKNRIVGDWLAAVDPEQGKAAMAVIEKFNQ